MHKLHLYIKFFIFFSIVFQWSAMANINLPKLVCFDKKEYNAGRQNWDVSVGDNGVVHFANSEGVLSNIYGEWKLSKLPKEGEVRSVFAENDTVWCGGNEYGYFHIENGVSKFNSLGVLKHEQIWDIVSIDNFIVFLTESSIIYYNKNTRTQKRQPYSNRVWSLVKWKNRLWGVQNDGKISCLESGEIRSSFFFKELVKVEIRKVFVQNQKLFIVLQKGVVYSFDGKKISLVKLPNELRNKTFFSGMSYDENSYCLGTITEGFTRINNQGVLMNSVSSKNLLLDDTVLAMDRDELGNVWLGLDYGVAKLEIQGPINQIFYGAATYDIKNYYGKTYIATNKGLFFGSNNSSFELIQNSGGQVWKINEIDNELYICQNNGFSKLEKDRVVSLIDYTGVFDLARFKGTDYFIFSTYNGMVLMKKGTDGFKYIKNLNIWGNKKLVADFENNCIWSEFYKKSISKLTLGEDGTIKEEVFNDFFSFFNTKNGVFFSDNEYIYQYKKQKFVLASQELTKNIKGPIDAMDYSGGHLGYIQNHEVKLSTLLPDGNIYSYNTLLKPLGKNTVYNFEYLDLDNNILRLATDRGVCTFEINYETTLKKNSEPVVSSLTVLNEENKHFRFPYSAKVLELSSGKKDLKFRYSINKFKYDVVEYRYKLYPKEKNWSKWSTDKNEVYIPQIKGGEYVFHLQAKVNGGGIQETSIEFVVEKTWDETLWVIFPIGIIVLGCFYGIAYVIMRVNRRKLKRQKDMYTQLDAKKTLSMKNEQLLQYSEIISHKNEFLNKLKLGLEKMRNSEAKRWVNMISKEVNNEKKEFLFHKLFSEVHQDFIGRITSEYPSLTNNDIRILSFIRTNLDKKEICNLMNITPRSLDTNRYRLKKKLNLDSEIDLNQFIREF